MSVYIETERLIIKDTISSDADLFLALLNTPKWIQNIGDRKVKTIHDAENYINIKIVPVFEKYGYANCTIYLKNSLQKIGIVGIYHRDETIDVDLGYALLPEFEKKGFAFEACQAMIIFARSETSLKELKAFINPDNIESIRLIKKLGFEYEKDFIFPDENKPVSSFSLKIQ